MTDPQKRLALALSPADHFHLASDADGAPLADAAAGRLEERFLADAAKGSSSWRPPPSPGTFLPLSRSDASWAASSSSAFARRPTWKSARSIASTRSDVGQLDDVWRKTLMEDVEFRVRFRSPVMCMRLEDFFAVGSGKAPKLVGVQRRVTRIRREEFDGLQRLLSAPGLRRGLPWRCAPPRARPR
jgi:hypothetical protein